MSFINVNRLEEILLSIPQVDAVLVLVFMCVVPVVLFLSLAYMYYRLSKKQPLRDTEITDNQPPSFRFALGYALHKHSGLIFLLVFVWTILCTVLQCGYIYRHLSAGVDITYYLQVNLPEYEGVNNIDSAQNLNSFNIVMLNWLPSPVRESEWISFLTKKSDDYDSATSVATTASDRRRLQQSVVRRLKNSLQAESSQTLSIVYHTSDWENMLSEEMLINICQTEKKMIAEMTCLNIWQYKSMIPSTFNSETCTFRTTYENELLRFGEPENSAYVKDGISSYYPKSEILISFFKTGTCGDYDESELTSMFSEMTVGEVEITYVSQDFIQTEFADSIWDAVFYAVVTVVFCFAFMILGIRGLGLTFITFWCILLSVAQATAMLPYWQYGYFSAFNVLSVFILIGVGANAVLMYGASFRRVTRETVTFSAAQFIESYDDIALSVLFTTCAACISLFSKLASPVIVISQLGAFLGVAVVVFYVLFHLLLLPVWIYTSRWHLPLAMHQALESWQDQCLAVVCCKFHSSVKPIQEIAASPSAPPTVEPVTFVPIVVGNGRESEFNPLVPVSDRDTAGADANLVHDFNNRLEVSNGDDNRSKFYWHCSPLVIAALIAVLATGAGMFGIYYAVNRSISVDFGIPQLFDPDTNIGESMYILKHYKSDIFTIHDSSVNPAPTAAPLGYPTFRPVGIPTRVPSASPVAHSVAPTLYPSYRPTVKPSMTSRPTGQSTRHDDYTVTGCWGIYAHKEYMDSEAELSFNEQVFAQYSRGTVVAGYFTNSGLLSDMQSMCNYIEANRDSLDVSPDWIKERDCIYDQFVAASQSSFWKSAGAPPFTVGNVLIYWASLDYTSGELLGIVATNTSYVKPLWLCFDVPARTDGVTSLTSDPNLAVSLSNKWQNAFKEHGITHASQYHVPSVIGSTEFTFPLLSAEVLFSIVLACLISAVGFVFLLIVFTKADVGLTIGGTLAMVCVVAVTVCAHVFIFKGDFDLLDVVVLVAVVGMAVDFPVHFICEFVRQQDKRATEIREEEWLLESERAREEIARNSSPENPNFHRQSISAARKSSRLSGEMSSSWLIGDEIVGALDRPHTMSRDGRPPAHALHAQPPMTTIPDEANSSTANQPSQPAAAKPQGLFPVLWKTHKHLSQALIAPLILTVLSGLPLFRAELMLLRKCGQYVVVLAIVSYIFCVFVLPYYMPLTCKVSTAWCKCQPTTRTRSSSSARYSSLLQQDEQDIPLAAETLGEQGYSHQLIVPLIVDYEDASPIGAPFVSHPPVLIVESAENSQSKF